jgi:hypothetical protein
MKIEECDECGEFIPEDIKNYCVWDDYSKFYLCQECSDNVMKEMIGESN